MIIRELCERGQQSGLFTSHGDPVRRDLREDLELDPEGQARRLLRSVPLLESREPALPRVRYRSRKGLPRDAAAQARWLLS